MAKQEREIINRLGDVMYFKKISAVDLADKVGLTPQTINRIRRNETQPTLRLLRQLAFALDVDVRELMVPTKEN